MILICMIFAYLFIYIGYAISEINEQPKIESRVKYVRAFLALFWPVWVLIVIGSKFQKLKP